MELTSARAYDLAMHLVGRHKNSAAVHSTAADNFNAHHHDHTGPGGVRNHPYYDYSYGEAEVEEVLEEAEEAE